MEQTSERDLAEIYKVTMRECKPGEKQEFNFFVIPNKAGAIQNKQAYGDDIVLGKATHLLVREVFVKDPNFETFPKKIKNLIKQNQNMELSTKIPEDIYKDLSRHYKFILKPILPQAFEVGKASNNSDSRIMAALTTGSQSKEMVSLQTDNRKRNYNAFSTDNSGLTPFDFSWMHNNTNTTQPKNSLEFNGQPQSEENNFNASLSKPYQFL